MRFVFTTLVLFTFFLKTSAQIFDLEQDALFDKVVDVYSSDTIYKGDKPCIILFYNNTCPFSRSVAAMINKYTNEYSQSIHFYKINVWKINDDVMAFFDIQGVPTTYFIKSNDEGADFLEGVPDEETLDEYIDWLLD